MFFFLLFAYGADVLCWLFDGLLQRFDTLGHVLEVDVCMVLTCEQSNKLPACWGLQRTVYYWIGLLYAGLLLRISCDWSGESRCHLR